MSFRMLGSCYSTALYSVMQPDRDVGTCANRSHSQQEWLNVKMQGATASTALWS